MSVVPNVTCRRCHRQYPAFRSRCPYCGTKKVREVRSATPETDSAVPGTQASRFAVETINWQMLIGAVLLLAVIIATIVLVSSKVSAAVEANPGAAQGEAAGDGTDPGGTMVSAPPIPTEAPSPSPTAPPSITNVQILWKWYEGHDYSGTGFTSDKGVPLTDFQVSWYPTNVTAIPKWSSSDESIVTVSPTEGNVVTITPVGESGQTATITVDVNGETRSMPVTVK